LLVAISILNWLASWFIEGIYGGSALGTEPVLRSELFVQSHGVRTHVIESVWFFSLAYSVVTLLLPCVSLWLLLPYIGRIQDRRDSDADAADFMKAVMVILSVLALLWLYLVVRDLTASLQAWRSLR